MNELMRRRAMMIGGINDPIISLLHLDGDFIDARGAQARAQNTYNYSFTEGKWGRGVQNTVDGKNGQVNVSVNDLLDTMPTQFTASLWVKQYTGGIYNYGLCVCSTNNGYSMTSGSGISIYIAPSCTAAKCYIYQKGTYSKSITINSTKKSVNDGNWHHHAVTYDNGTVRWYMDGVKIAEHTFESVSDSFDYKGPAIRWNALQIADELMFSDKLLIVGDIYDVPTAPFK